MASVDVTRRAGSAREEQPPRRPPPQPAATDGLRGLAATVGNGAFGRWVSAAGPVLARHPGKEKLTKPHVASDHADAEDQREHERQDHERFSEMTSDQLAAELKEHATEEKVVRRIDPKFLPPMLQALVRRIVSLLADIHQRGPKDVSARISVRATARSWHEDTQGKVPERDPSPSLANAGAFFETWLDEDVKRGTHVPNKQRQKGYEGSRRPLREFNALGWKEDADKGRLILDPVAGCLYLSLFHYGDDKYFQIDLPAIGGGSAAQQPREWDLELLLYEAWERLARDLDELAGQASKLEEPETLGPTYTNLDPRVQRYLLELYKLRQAYSAARAAALSKKEAARGKRAQQAKLANLSSKASQGGKKKAATATVDEKPAKEPEEYAPFSWCNQVFSVASDSGYICYEYKGSQVGEPYDSATTVGDLATLFADCVDSQRIADLAATGRMLAGFVAEPTRHPPAAVEALLVALGSTPFKSSDKAFGKGVGTALPMATGGTIATGGVPMRVVRAEAQMARRLIVSTLTANTQLREQDVEAGLLKVLEQGAEPAIARFKTFLRAALLTAEGRKSELAAAKKAASKQRKPAVSDVREPEAPAPTAEPAVVAPDLNGQTTSVELVATGEAAPSIAEQPAPALTEVVTIARNLDAPPEPIVVVVPGQGGLPTSTGEAGPTTKARAVRGRSRWTQLADNILGWSESTGPLAPQEVLAWLIETQEYEEFDNFWDAYDAFRADYPELEFELSPVQVINLLNRQSPTRLYIMHPDDWEIYESFKAQHPEFVYPR